MSIKFGVRNKIVTCIYIHHIVHESHSKSGQQQGLRKQWIIYLKAILNDSLLLNLKCYLSFYQTPCDYMIMIMMYNNSL